MQNKSSCNIFSELTSVVALPALPAPGPQAYPPGVDAAKMVQIVSYNFTPFIFRKAVCIFNTHVVHSPIGPSTKLARPRPVQLAYSSIRGRPMSSSPDVFRLIMMIYLFDLPTHVDTKMLHN